MITRMGGGFVIAVINIIGCLEKDAKSGIKNELLSFFDQFFVEPKKITLKSMDGRFVERKLLCDNYSFFIEYESTFASIPINEIGQILRKAYCKEVDIYQINI